MTKFPVPAQPPRRICSAPLGGRRFCRRHAGPCSTLGQDARGSGTVLAVGLMAVCLLMLVVAATAGRYFVAVHRARTAADLGALAGAAAAATALAEDTGYSAGPCAAATRIVLANGAQQVRCGVVGDPTDFVVSVRVEVSVRPNGWALPAGVVAEAHAGPADISTGG